MPGNFIRFLALASGAATVAGIAYTALAIARVRRFRRTAAAFTQRAGTPVSILKPLHGSEPRLFENLLSFCEQTYPEYQVIFGAADQADPALDVARAVAERFPDRDIEIVCGNSKPAANPKVGNLLGMIDRARHALLIIADSDICAPPNYLHAVAACFDDPQTGAATCAYGGVPVRGFASKLGAMQVNDHFTPSVMVADFIEPLTYCFGATMAIRKDVLQQFGGLEAVADRLADDYLIGNLVTRAGYTIALVPCAVQTTVSDESFSSLWRHELRWARTVLAQRRAGYIGSVVTNVLPFAAIFACTARTPLSIASLAAASALRLLLHAESQRTFAPRAGERPWLIPVRDFLSAAVWCASFLGNQVHWKRDSYHLDAGGRMAPGPKEM